MHFLLVQFEPTLIFTLATVCHVRNVKTRVLQPQCISRFSRKDWSRRMETETYLLCWSIPARRLGPSFSLSLNRFYRQWTCWKVLPLAFTTALRNLFDWWKMTRILSTAGYIYNQLVSIPTSPAIQLTQPSRTRCMNPLPKSLTPIFSSFYRKARLIFPCCKASQREPKGVSQNTLC